MSPDHALAGLLGYIAAMLMSALVGFAQACVTAARGRPLPQITETIGGCVCLWLAFAGALLAPLGLLWLAVRVWRGS